MEKPIELSPFFNKVALPRSPKTSLFALSLGFMIFDVVSPNKN